MTSARMNGQAGYREYVARGLACAFVASIVVSASPGPSLARIWNVLADGTGDAPFIQAAVDSASNGDEILVGPGSYAEVVEIAEKSLVVRSASGPAATTLQALGAGERTRPPDNEVTVSGFTFSGSPVFGGGVVAGSLRRFELVECRFANLRYASEVYNVREAIVRDCLFENNIDTNSGDLGGGALELHAAPDSPGYLIEGCVFRNNERTHGTPSRDGGGALAAGGPERGPIVIRNCLFDGNRAPSGGAAFISGYVIMSHCTFVNNVSENGAVFMNTPTRDPWGVYQCIFAFNSRVGLYTSGAGHCGCNVYWQNEITDYAGSCAQEPERGWGSFAVDPGFCDRAMSDYRLSETSPLIGPFDDPVHAECEGPLGAFGPGCKINPVLESSWGEIKARFK